MKKAVGLLLAALVIAYPLTARWVGGRVEASLDELYHAPAAHPAVSIVAREYQRGWLSSQDSVTFRISFEALHPPGQPPTDAAEVAPVEFTVRSSIKHGPLAGLTFAAAVADSELILPANTPPAIAQLFGEQGPLSVRTVIRFDGSYATAVRSPAFATEFDGGSDSGTVRMNWGGLEIDATLAKDFSAYTTRASLPKLEMTDEHGTSLLFTGFSSKHDARRFFPEVPFLFGGTTELRLEQFTFNHRAAGTSIKNLRYEASLPLATEFADFSTKAQADVLQINQRSYGPALLDITFKHLHARSFASLIQTFMAANLQPNSDPAALAASAQQIFTIGNEILKHGPVLQLNRVSTMSEFGEAHANGQFELKDAALEDLMTPGGLWPKVAIDAEIVAPQELLASSFAPAQAQMAKAILGALAGQGYLRDDHGSLGTKIVIRDGNLTLNGKAFDPRALGGNNRGSL